MHSVIRTHAYARRLASIAGILSFALACGSGESTAPEVSSASAPSESASAPSASPSAPSEAGAAGPQQPSAEAQRCLDLVRSKNYIAALDPCQRAVANGASANVEAALAEAKATGQEALVGETIPTGSELEASLRESAEGAMEGESQGQDAANALRAFGEGQDR